MTYNVLMGRLNPTHSLTHPFPVPLINTFEIINVCVRACIQNVHYQITRCHIFLFLFMSKYLSFFSMHIYQSTKFIISSSFSLSVTVFSWLVILLHACYVSLDYLSFYCDKEPYSHFCWYSDSYAHLYVHPKLRWATPLYKTSRLSAQ